MVILEGQGEDGGRWESYRGKEYKALNSEERRDFLICYKLAVDICLLEEPADFLQTEIS